MLKKKAKTNFSVLLSAIFVFFIFWFFNQPLYVIARNGISVQYPTDTTQHHSRPRTCFGCARSLFFFNKNASALGQLEVCFWFTRSQVLGSALSRSVTQTFFSFSLVSPPLVYFNYIKCFFRSNFRVCFWNRVCLLCPLWVYSGSCWNLLGVSSLSAIADLKQTLSGHKKQMRGLVRVCSPLGLV